MRICEHGAKEGWWAEPGRAWNGALSLCDCCHSTFGFVNSFNITREWSSGKLWSPLDRCGRCGGEYKEW